MPRSPDRIAISSPRVPHWLAATLLGALCAVGVSAVVRADEPLHQRIDRLIEADPLIPLAPPASDAEFLAVPRWTSSVVFRR